MRETRSISTPPSGTVIGGLRVTVVVTSRLLVFAMAESLYVIEGDSVKVRIPLFKGEKGIGSFIVEDGLAAVDKLARNIVSEAERMLPCPEHNDICG